MTFDRRAAFKKIAKGEDAGVPYLVSAWQHLVGHEYGAEDFGNAYADFVKKWDWEWVKVNPRAIYYAEAWGGKYDPDDYQGYVIPRTVKPVITAPEDLVKVTRLDVAANPVFTEQIGAARIIRQRLSDRGVIDTTFSPLSILLQLADLPLYPGDEHAHPSVTIDQIFTDHKAEALTALDNIARTIADYVATLVTPEAQGGAGLDGIFYAVTGTVSEDYFDEERYAEFGAPYDRIVIDAIHAANPDAVILLHTCRDNSHPERFANVGADILQWDQYLEGNPDINADLGPVPVGGASFTLFDEAHGDAGEAAKEIDAIIAARQGRPFLLAPSCTVPTPASDAALKALSDARVK